MIRRIFLVLVLLLSLSLNTAFSTDFFWYKGNIHCHTSRSDGDTPPIEVAKWYRLNGYHFLAITDHDIVTNGFSALHGNDFITIPGEEVTDSYKGKPLHVNAINIIKAIKPMHGTSVVSILQNDIDAIITAGGIAQLNHPNWHWAYNNVEISKLKNVKLLEIYNHNKNHNNFGGGNHLSTEEIWDNLLTKGILIYGTASDDAHTYKGKFTSDQLHPGKAWLQVKAPELKAVKIVDALMNGQFYGTTGVILKNVVITDKQYIVDIRQIKDEKYKTIFIGKGGQVLATGYKLKAVYTFTGNEKYVRSKIISSTGDFAITQPFLIKK